MKKLLVKLIGISLLAFYFLACDEDRIIEHDPVSRTNIQFAKIDSAISEGSSTSLIWLSFDKPAASAGSIRLSIDTTNARHINTSPALTGGQITINFSEGASKVSLAVTPRNNSTADGNREIVVTLNHASNGFMIGARKSFQLKILDDETPGHANQNHVNFIPANLSIKEERAEWYELQIHVSENTTAEGSATIEALSERAQYGLHFLTEPALNNNRVRLAVLPGTSVIKLKVKATNDEFIVGNSIVKFRISATSGNIVKGALLEDSITILDDELRGMPKGYDISSTSWGLRKEIEYDAMGRVAKVLWNSYTPYHSQHADTYYYNERGELNRINTDPGQDLLYQYVNGRIAMEQKIANGEIVRYTEYDYDQFGNVNGYNIHHLQPDQTFKLTSTTVLLYYTDGNLYKKLVYTPSTDPENPYLSSTETYENYLDVSNDFGIEFIPGIKAQPMLPGSYRVEANGKDLRYTFSYQFTSDGKPSKRTVVGPNTFEVAAYHYY